MVKKKRQTHIFGYLIIKKVDTHTIGQKSLIVFNLIKQLFFIFYWLKSE